MTPKNSLAVIPQQQQDQQGKGKGNEARDPRVRSFAPRPRRPAPHPPLLLQAKSLSASGFTARRTSSGDHTVVETPVPIPNTVVKPIIVDGTAPEKVWESRTLPG